MMLPSSPNHQPTLADFYEWIATGDVAELHAAMMFVGHRLGVVTFEDIEVRVMAGDARARAASLTLYRKLLKRCEELLDREGGLPY
jgi:hypothetical protein